MSYRIIYETFMMRNLVQLWCRSNLHHNWQTDSLIFSDFVAEFCLWLKTCLGMWYLMW